ncbi:MAG: hypothetical protein JSS81_09905 [Acidobacteria bacterium]|nr:hypothetical protein [Acidobacteriota bacterium]
MLVISNWRRRSNLLEQNPPKNLSAADFRPLFEPTEDEIRAFERAEQARLDAARAEERRRIADARIGETREFAKSWSLAPDRKGTIELLFRASQTENAEIFSEISENVLQLWREHRIENLTALELADLLDSHFRILPQQERTSGAVFRLREEIGRLRARSEEID